MLDYLTVSAVAGGISHNVPVGYLAVCILGVGWFYVALNLNPALVGIFVLISFTPFKGVTYPVVVIYDAGVSASVDVSAISEVAVAMPFTFFEVPGFNASNLKVVVGVNGGGGSVNPCGIGLNGVSNCCKNNHPLHI